MTFFLEFIITCAIAVIFVGFIDLVVLTLQGARRKPGQD